MLHNGCLQSMSFGAINLRFLECCPLPDGVCVNLRSTSIFVLNYKDMYVI